MHGVSNGRLNRALKAQEAAGGTLHCDQRGRHEPGNKTKPETVDSVKAHHTSTPFQSTLLTIRGKTTHIDSS